MATVVWIANAPTVAQMNTLTVAGTAASTQVYSVTINGKAIAYTAGVSDTNTTIATALQALLAASTIPEFAEVTWANPSAGVITGTANTPGYPFTNTSAATGTGTLVTSTTTTSSGPNDVDVAANYSGGALPVNGDDLYLTNSSQGLLYNLDALSGVTLNSLTVDSTFTGQVGLPSVNPNGYAEYRPTAFQISATTENYLPGSGGGSPLINRDNGSAAWTVNVNGTGSPAIQGLPAIFLKGSNTGNVLNVTKGSVGTALSPGETGKWATINIGYQQSQNTDVSLALGAGVTLTTINQDGGQVAINSNVTTLTQRGGSSAIYGAAAVGTLDVEAGTCLYQSSGTITTATVGVGGTLDFSKDPRARTVTNATIYGSLKDPNHTVTHTNPASFPNGIGNQGATLDWGTAISLARS